jgi:hypothetical protein
MSPDSSGVARRAKSEASAKGDRVRVYLNFFVILNLFQDLVFFFPAGTPGIAVATDIFNS